MPDLIEAHSAYKRADEEALLMRFRARARLGAVVTRRFDEGDSLEDMAKALEKTSEQVRRYRQAYRDWLRDHPGVPLD
jgi:nucleoid-associated protein YgaU